MNMRKFATFMSVLGIVVLLGTCAVFVAARKGFIQIDTAHIQSVVFCSLGIAFLCFVPSKIVVYQEAKTEDEDETAEIKSRNAVILNGSAGLILIGLSIFKYFKN